MDALQQIRNILAHLNREGGHVYGPALIPDAEFDRSKYDEQESDIAGIKTELVDQRRVGDDSFEGNLAYQLATGEWFVVAFG